MPISSEQAMKFVQKAPDKYPDEWKAVHDLVRFWGYLALLVNEGYIKESTAFEAFGVPRILVFCIRLKRRLRLIAIRRMITADR